MDLELSRKVHVLQNTRTLVHKDVAQSTRSEGADWISLGQHEEQVDDLGASQHRVDIGDEVVELQRRFEVVFQCVQDSLDLVVLHLVDVELQNLNFELHLQRVLLESKDYGFDALLNPFQQEVVVMGR